MVAIPLRRSRCRQGFSRLLFGWHRLKPCSTTIAEQVELTRIALCHDTLPMVDLYVVPTRACNSVGAAPIGPPWDLWAEGWAMVGKDRS